ncbi:MAG: hypothetical protein KDE27_05585, partial [Planctomycetes bacterium]|nr:hypothetical protein [Planctomycetota bacterium]
MTAGSEDAGELSPAAVAFADYLALLDDGEVVDFEHFVREHGSHAAELRRLHARWQALNGAFADLGSA